MASDLFSRDGSLHDYIEKRKQDVAKKVESINAERLLSCNEYDLCKALVEDFTIQVPVLQRELWQSQHREATISQNSIYRDSVSYLDGCEVMITIPFTGETILFYLKPSQWKMGAIRGRVSISDKVMLVYNIVKPDEAEVRRSLDYDLDFIEFHLSNLRGDTQRFNESLPTLIEDLVIRRKTRLLEYHKMMVNLGIPLRRREDAPQTYALSVRPRKPAIDRVLASAVPYELEPVLQESEYENILRVINNMALVMERSPSAFLKMSEEHLRVHFLVQLNAQYEWDALPEVFNLSGKTDILIRYQGRTVFIAECKYWRGPKSLSAAVNQLLGYVSWRDTKTAILLFNREGNMTNILEKVPQIVENHSAYKTTVRKIAETGYRFVLGNPDDSARELILTVLVFNVPNPTVIT